MVYRTLTAQYSVELGFSFDTTLGSNLEYLRSAVMRQDFDAAVLVDGNEGSGKSVLGMQIAKFLDIDRELDLETQVCFTPQQFQKAVMTLRKGKAIVWDEARSGLNRRRSTQGVNLEITDMLSRCRARNLFMIIIMPSFYDMDMNVAIWRSRALVHVWYEWDKNNKEYPLVRGFFRFYNEGGKKDLYTNKLLRLRYEYPHLPNESFDSRFVEHYVVNEGLYRQRKREAEESVQQRSTKAKIDYKPIVGHLMEHLRKGGVLYPGAVTEAAEFFNVHRNRISEWGRLPMPDLHAQDYSMHALPHGEHANTDVDGERQ